MAVQTITYEDKSYLNQNADIPATNKVQDTDMNEIKSVVNNNANETNTNTNNITNILSAEIYSTSEVKTNYLWTNNKPIYRKVITGQCTTANNWETIGSVTNIDRLIEAKGIIGGYLPFPTFVTTSYNASIQKSGSNIQARTVGYTNTEMTIVLLYTKTTD